MVFGVQRLVPTYDMTWYKDIKKPKWTPPNIVFPLVWIPLKIMQSVALWLVWKSVEPKTAALAAFGIHLALGNYWNITFFGRHEMRRSIPVMLAFWASIAASIATFSATSPAAAYLMVPTQIWVSIAAKLNYDIVKLNPDKD